MGAFSDLYGLVSDAYQKEKDRSDYDSTRNAGVPYWAISENLSIFDLTEDECNTYLEDQKARKSKKKKNNEVSLCEIYEVWKKLVDVLMEKDVFLEHAKTLAKGFKACLPNKEGKCLIEEENYVHVETLLHLLIHTAENAHIDDSTECRFVTLLEVLLSYAPGWDPSQDVSKLWIRLMQRIPYQCPPINFRRKAYRVLVSLSWVPSSSTMTMANRQRKRRGGLLAACSIEERKMHVTSLPKASHTFRSASNAAEATLIVPRHDSVNQLLDRLKDEMDVCVALFSKLPGMGKATLASLVASHPSIQKSFYVVWLKLPTQPPTPAEDATAAPDEKLTLAGTSAMSFASYCGYVTQIRDQIREQQPEKDIDQQTTHYQPIDIVFPTCEPKFEEPAVRNLRELSAIRETQRKLAHALNALKNPKLLLVLENVTSDAQIPLFRFHDQQSIIITTTQENMKNVDWQVAVDPMSSQEAMDLFMGQAGLPLNHPLGWTPELKMLLENDCQSHPLLIRSVGRWCRLKAVCAGPIRACKEILKEIEALAAEAMAYSTSNMENSISMGSVGNLDNSMNSHNGGNVSIMGNRASDEMDNKNNKKDIVNTGSLDEINRFLFDILSLTMGPQRVDGAGTSAIFVVCLAAMAVVFPGRVPLDVVLLLWEQILLVEPLTSEEVQDLNGEDYFGEDSSIDVRRKYVGLVAEGLLHMGMIEIYEAEDDRQSNGGAGGSVGVGGCIWIEIHHEMYAKFALSMAEELDLGESFEHTVQEWHKAFVTSYFAQRIQGDRIDAGGRNSLEYAVRSLPTHIFQANMLKMAETMLTDAKFFETRVEALGWEKAVEVQIQDCMQLQSGLDDEDDEDDADSADSPKAKPVVMSPVFAKTSEIFATYAERDHGGDEKAADKAFEDVSKALYQMAFALAEHGYFEEALAQFDAAHDFSPESARLDASIEFGIAWVLLITGDSKRAMTRISESLDLMEELGKNHVLYKEAKQLQIDILYERCEYIKALGIVEEAEAELLDDVKDDNLIELGAVMKKKGFVLQIMGNVRKAADAYTKAIEWKQKADEVSYGLASCYCQLGDINMELHSLSVAKENFELAIETLVRVDCDPEHVQYLLSVGKSRFLKSDFARCFMSLELARETISVTPLYLMDQSAYDLRCIAQTYQARGNLDDAIVVLQEALELTKHRPRSLERAVCLSDVGRCLLDRKREQEGLACLEESLTIKIESLGQSIELLEMMHTIGKVHRLRAEYEESLNTYARAERLLKSVAPDDTEKAALVHIAVGEVYEAKGDTSDALNAYKKAMDLLKRTHASDDLLIGKTNHCMGRALASSNRMDEARKRLSEAIRIRSRNYDEIGLPESQFALGVVSRKIGKYDSSLKYLNEALTIRRNRSNGSHEHIETLFEIANTYRLSGRHDEAYPIYEECLNKLDPQDPLRGDVYQAMGNWMLLRAKVDEALLFFRRAKDIRQSSYGPEHRKTAGSIRGIGLSQLISGQNKEAQTTFESLLPICEKLAKAPSNSEKNVTKRDYTLAAMFLGDAYLANHSTQEASFLWNKAKTICQEAERGVGVDIHPHVKDMFDRRITALNAGSPISFGLQEALPTEAVLFVDD